MSTVSLEPIREMIATLPEQTQQEVVEQVREYMAELLDEMHWEAQYRATQAGLARAADEARCQIAEGLSEPMDYSRL